MVRLLYRDTDQLKIQQLLFWAVLGLVFPLPTANLPLCLSSLPLRDKDVSHSTRHSQGSPELQAALSITLGGGRGIASSLLSLHLVNDTCRLRRVASCLQSEGHKFALVGAPRLVFEQHSGGVNSREHPESWQHESLGAPPGVLVARYASEEALPSCLEPAPPKKTPNLNSSASPHRSQQPSLMTMLQGKSCGTEAAAKSPSFEGELQCPLLPEAAWCWKTLNCPRTFKLQRVG